MLAEQLNIGLDSMVFVDDNPVERARIRDSLESVEVPELPDDPAYYVRTISESGYFESVELTTEDKERTSLYAANARRKTLQRASQSLDDFLKGLGMVLTFGPVTDVNLLRAGQLINKTNQFNTTTLRMQEQELARFSSQRGNLALQFRLADRFGDNGLVSVMLFAAGGAPGSLELVNWVMSCRVFGRQLEFEAMNIAVEVAKNSGASVFYAQYIPTSKNSVISDLFSSLGFTIENESPDGGSQLYSLTLSDYAPKETCIDREAQPDG
jgi:FkbH-like protein